MNNNKRLNNKRLVLKRQKETVYYRNIRLKRRKQDPQAKASLSPKKEKIQDSRNLVEIDAQTRRRDANKTRARVRRHPTVVVSLNKNRRFHPKRDSENDVHPSLCPFRETKFLIFRDMKKNEMQRFSNHTYTRVVVREKERLLSLSLSLSLLTKVYRMQCESQSTKKTFANIPLTRLNLLRICDA